MKYLSWLLKAAIFFVLFAFALNNQGMVQVNLLFGAHWQAPLVLVLLLTMAIGIALGILVMLPLWLKERRLHRRSETAQHSLSRPDTQDFPLDHGA